MTTVLASLRPYGKPRRRRLLERPETGLTCKARAVHVRYKGWYISAAVLQFKLTLIRNQGFKQRSACLFL